MTDDPSSKTEEPDPNDSPFEIPPIEGIPFKKGSEEDLAIKRIIRESEEYWAAKRAAAAAERAHSG